MSLRPDPDEADDPQAHSRINRDGVFQFWVEGGFYNVDTLRQIVKRAEDAKTVYDAAIEKAMQPK